MTQARGGITCGNCGTVNSPGDEFCSNCGYALAGGPTAQTVVSPLGAYGGRRVTGSLAVGSLLSGRYQIAQMVGKGGFGAVYRANDERFQSRRVVAIKEMSDANLNQAERAHVIQDFRQEADLLVQLSHPNLPNVSDFFEEGGKAYLVMEFIEGRTLEKVQEDAKGPLAEQLVMGWALQLCDVLHYLHTRPQAIIFRDMKPSNVMVTKDNQIKLIDFGIARIFKSTAKKDTSLLGSQGYAPLEQYGRSQSDPRSDIYALGATLYDLLTNSVPADAPSRRINPQVFETPRQINPNISQAREEIVLRAMAEEPQNRFQSAEEMREAILMSGVVSTSSGFYSSATLPNTVPSQPFVPRPPTPRGTTVPQQAQTIISGGTAGSRSAPNLRGQPSQPPASAGPSAAPMTPVYPQAPIPGSPSPGRRGVSRRGLLIAGAAGVVVVALGGTGLYLATRGGGGSGAPPPLTGPSITVNFTYSTEKADWLTAAISTFNKSGTSLNGKVVQVALDPRGSGEAKDSILNGAIQPTAWSPASSLELSQLSGAWQLAHQGKDVIGSGDLFTCLQSTCLRCLGRAGEGVAE